MKLNTLRPRRLRRTNAIRSMVRENSLEINDFVYPISSFPVRMLRKKFRACPDSIICP